MDIRVEEGGTNSRSGSAESGGCPVHGYYVASCVDRYAPVVLANVRLFSEVFRQGARSP
jgi:hypothetical protein